MLTVPVWSELDEEDSKWRAKMELGMTKETVCRDIQHLKSWLHNHPYLPTLTGVNEDKWLENYLFLNKNKMERAKSNLELYFKIRTLLPEAFTNRHPLSPDMIKSFNSTCIAIIPKLTAEGRMICIYHHLNKNVSDFEMVPVGKRLIATIDIQLREGINRTSTVIIVDLINSTFGHLAKYQPLRLLRAFFNLVWRVYPERISQIHIINPPMLLTAALAFFRPFLKEKIRKRITVHSNLDSLYEWIPKTHLPSDYGGECKSLKELNDDWQKIMLENAEWLEICGKGHKIPEENWPIEEEEDGNNLSYSFSFLN